MFTLKSLVAIAAMAMLASAAPAPGAALEARQNDYADVKACEHPEFTGACITFRAENNRCQDVPAVWDNRISSIRNDNRSKFECRWYEHFGCQGKSHDHQHDPKLQDGNGFFDDRISSIKCWKK